MKTTFTLNSNNYEVVFHFEKKNDRYMTEWIDSADYDHETRTQHIHDKNIQVYVYIHNTTNDTYTQIYREYVKYGHKLSELKKDLQHADLVDFLNITEKELKERQSDFYKINFQAA